MTEKIGLIKNPLTIIAIFAGIAEVSGTIVLPFVAVQNQELFIWFLILFPSSLVIIFFATLNFNNKVLYAPSDYRDESNYLTSNKYNAITQSTAIIKEPINSAFETLTQRMNYLSSEAYANDLKKLVAARLPIDAASSERERNRNDKDEYSYQLAADLNRKELFIAKMRALGYNVTVYVSPVSPVSPKPGIENQAIWVGANVPLGIVKEVIREAKREYSFLKFIQINDSDSAPIDTYNEIFIGGSTKAAVGDLRLRALSDKDFEHIDSLDNWGEFNSFLSQFKNL